MAVIAGTGGAGGSRQSRLPESDRTSTTRRDATRPAEIPRGVSRDPVSARGTNAPSATTTPSSVPQDAFVRGGGGGGGWTENVGRASSARRQQDVDIGQTSHDLMATYGGASPALERVITARGGDPGQNVSPEQQQAARAELQRQLGLSAPLTDTQLRDVDHYINSYSAAHNGNSVLAPRDGDNWLQRKAKTLGRSVLGLGQSAVVVGYTGAKMVAQAGGPDLVGATSEFQGTGHNVSRAGLDEIRHGLAGVWQGVYDEKPGNE